jgi:DNA invertase Pin-like site-specific DNA recombinase
MPEANEMVVGIMAVVAEAERKKISARTKAALQAAKPVASNLAAIGAISLQSRRRRTLSG